MIEYRRFMKKEISNFKLNKYFEDDFNSALLFTRKKYLRYSNTQSLKNKLFYCFKKHIESNKEKNLNKKQQNKKIILFKSSLIIFCIVLICLAIYLPLKLTGALSKINNIEDLKEVIISGGAYSYLILFAIQFLQTTIIPIPAAITTIAGTLVFGSWITLGISLLAVLSGSIFAYFLGKKFGRKIIIWVAGEKSAAKWEEKLNKGKYVYFLMMLFPFFPDDILCIVAGAINMSFKFFLITNLITRPIVYVTLCFFGSGSIIPYSGWGLIVWAILIIIGLILFYLSYKFQPQIENFVEKLGKKLNKRDKK